ncbi:MAG: DMT family transporter [Candidatus Beckwithbacteria bacterium]|nr:DMT family transporter [Patescibacteria group bacterium]
MKFQNGIKLALVTALISGVSIFVNGLAVKSVGDPLVLTTVKGLGVGLFVAIWIMGKKIKWWEINKSDWGKLLVIAVIGGSVPFYLFFKGLMIAESAKAALIHKTLIFWVAAWAIPMLKEKISLKQWGALSLIVLSNLVIGGVGKWSWGMGETMILLATILWAVENVMAKIVLKKVRVEIVVGARMILGSVLLLFATIATGKINLIFKLSLMQWGMVLVTAGLLFGYVVSWYKALSKAPVTLVATVLSLGSVISSILSSIFITRNLTFGLLSQTILLIAGTWFFSMEARKNARIVKMRQVRIFTK